MKTVSQKFISVSTAAFLLANLAAAVAPAALAADMLGDQSVELTPVEYGTGWYLRGDIIATVANDHFDNATSETITGTTDQRVTDVETNNVIGAGVGIGYRLSNNIRIEANYEYLGSGEKSLEEPLPVTGLRRPCEGAYQIDSEGNVSGGYATLPDGTVAPVFSIQNCISSDETAFSLSGLNANAYYEFNNSFMGLRPFIGAGIGVVRAEYTTDVGSTTCVAATEQRCNPGDGGRTEFGRTYVQQGVRDTGISYHFAPSISAGFSYDMGNNLHFDTSYRYTKLMEDALYGGSSSLDKIGIPTDFHSIKMGLRYEIW